MAKKIDGKAQKLRRKSDKLSKELTQELREEADREQRLWEARPEIGKDQTSAAKSEPLSKNNAPRNALSAARQLPVNASLMGSTSIILAIATGIGLLLGAVFLGLEGGMDAVRAMGGVLPVATVPLQTAQTVFALDILFPVFFGSGLALFATSLQSRGNRPLIRLVLTAILVAVLADFGENSLVFNMLTGEELHPLRWPLTVVKYAALAFAGVMISCIIPVAGVLSHIARLITRFLFPVSIALLVSGIGGEVVGDVVGAAFPLSLFVLSIFAASMAGKHKAE